MSAAATTFEDVEVATVEEEETKTYAQAAIELRHLLDNIRRPTYARGFLVIDDPDDIPPDIRPRCAAQLEFLQDFKQNWRPSSSHLFNIPKNWLDTDLEQNTGPLAIDFVGCQVSAALEPLEGHFHACPDAEIAQNSTDSESWKPDFLLTSPPHYERPFRSDMPNTVEAYFRPNARRSALPFLEVFHSPGEKEQLLQASFRVLRNTPGSWMIGSPVLDFPPVTEGAAGELPASSNICSDPCTDFACILNFFHSKSLASKVDKLPISLSHPALLVGIRSRTPLIHEPVPDSPASARLAPHREKLSRAAQSSLDTHILNWSLTHPDQSLDSLPPWLMIFGLIYDDESLQILAHIPYLSADESSQHSPHLGGYLSYLLDEIPFPPRPLSESLSFWLDRMRMAMALFSLQRHIFRLSTLWEPSANHWPLSIQRAEAMRDEKYTGRNDSDTGSFNNEKSEEQLRVEQFIAEWGMDDALSDAEDAGDPAPTKFPAVNQRPGSDARVGAHVLNWLQDHRETWEDSVGRVS